MEPNQIVLYVNDIVASRAFYGEQLGYELTELSPTFCVVVLHNGWSMALKERDGTVDDGRPVGGFELVIDLPTRKAVDEFSVSLRSGNVELDQEPTDMPFGYALVVVDPDGVRFRVGHFPQG